MLRVYVHLTTGEKLKSFRARKFDVDLGKQREAGVQKYTYTGPEGEEETIYLNPRGVAAIELRHVKEGTEQEPGGPPAGDRARPSRGRGSGGPGGRALLLDEDGQERDPPPRGPEGPDALESPE